VIANFVPFAGFHVDEVVERNAAIPMHKPGNKKMHRVTRLATGTAQSRLDQLQMH
jgi:hypothetical protein